MKSDDKHDFTGIQIPRATRRPAPLLFDALYPMLVFVILVSAACWLGYLKLSDLTFWNPVNPLIRTGSNYLRYFQELLAIPGDWINRRG